MNVKKPALKFDTRQDAAFTAELKQAAKKYLDDNRTHKHADARFFAKLIFLLILAIVFYANALQANTLGVYILYFAAFMWTSMMLSMNSFHDASHGSVFRKPKYNRWLMAIVCIPMGTDPNYWALRHVHFHHTYPNIDGYDLDTEPNPALRQTPFQNWSPQYQYQHLYWPLVAAISLGYLCWVSDWLDRFGKTPLTIFSYLKKPGYWFQFFALKFFHLSIVFLIPLIALQDTFILWWQILGVYFLIQAFVSWFLVTTILGTHWADVDFFNPKDDHKIPHSWQRHAFLTACDWQANPRWLNNWLGGLDLHLTHHLLPAFSNRHYVALADIVAKLAEKHAMPYRRISYTELFKLQQRFLKKMGRNPNKGNVS
ncbi:MAG: acyl-CoA desaturase [Gammaproteobacteria bacterium]|nr:MAG: acyl-CoA desaturase [Gammaproteobacteria bacterium]